MAIPDVTPTKEFLEESGVDMSEYPGLGVLVILWLFAFQVIVGQLPQGISSFVSTNLFNDILLVSAASLSIFIYKFGGSWDKIWFEPRYGIDGTYLKRIPLLSRKQRLPMFSGAKRIPVPLLSSGVELDKFRQVATEFLRESPENEMRIDVKGRGAYKVSKETLIKADEWRKVRGSLNWSKVSRSLIYPSLPVAVLCGILAVIAHFWTWISIILLMLVLVICGLLLALIFFLGYVNLRVYHMVKVYKLVLSNTPWRVEWLSMGRQCPDEKNRKKLIKRLDQLATTNKSDYTAYVCKGVSLGLRGIYQRVWLR